MAVGRLHFRLHLHLDRLDCLELPSQKLTFQDIWRQWANEGRITESPVPCAHWVVGRPLPSLGFIMRHYRHCAELSSELVAS